jgi:GNAT superfamily N-acetyltransferase
MAVPFAPELNIRPLQPEQHLAHAGALVNHMLQRAPYSAPLTDALLRQQLFDPQPPTLFPVQWQARQLLGAWRAGELLGLADVAACLEADESGGSQTVGLLRFLVLPERAELVAECARHLLAAAEQFWRTQRVGVVRAFPIASGYPTLQGGAGLLPGDWSDQVQVLTANGYHFEDRYYCLTRPAGLLLEEVAPQTGLSLAFRGDDHDRRYQIFFRRTELIAEARLLRTTVAVGDKARTVGYLAEWTVDARWHNQKVGRWLLRRALNDATQRGLAEVVLHVQLQQAAALNLLGQHGFAELNYRGYTFGKTLTV